MPSQTSEYNPNAYQPYENNGPTSPSPSQRQSYNNQPPLSPQHQPHLSPHEGAYSSAPTWGSGFVGSSAQYGGGAGGSGPSSSGHGHPLPNAPHFPSAMPATASLASVKQAEAEAARAAAEQGRGESVLVHEDGGRIDGDAPPSY